MTDDEINEVKKRLRLSRDTWQFFWKTPLRGTKIGDRAGVMESSGYRRIMVNKKNYREHRLVWLFEHGAFPITGVDHIDGNRANNNPANLRLATHAQNQQNRAKIGYGTTGFLGVTYLPDGKKYVAQISVNGKHRYLGRFASPEDAYAAYLDAKASLHTFNPVPRT